MATELTALELGLIDDLKLATQQMVKAVARTGSGLYMQEVEYFQAMFNTALPMVTRMYKAGDLGVYPFAPQRLVEDGQYGPRTSEALWLVIGDPQPPRRASGMPQWYAANAALIDSLVAPNPVNVGPDIGEAEAFTPVNNDVTAGQMVEQAQSSGSTVVDMITPEDDPGVLDPYGPEQGIPQPVWGPGGQQDYSTPWWKASDPGSYPLNVINEQGCPSPKWLSTHEEAIEANKVLFERCLPGGETQTITEVVDEPEEIQFEETIPILAPPPQRDYRLIAAGVAAVALGGVLWAFTRKKGRRS